MAGARYTVLALNPEHTRVSASFADDHQCAFWSGSQAPAEREGSGGVRRQGLSSRG